jgi:ribosomal protein S12 methylthiotransferase
LARSRARAHDPLDVHRRIPGRDGDDFNELLEWLEQAELDRVGCFKFEAVRDAAANALPNAVPEEIKEERWHRFMAAQQAISERRLRRRVGREIDVIVDEIDDEEGQALGRSTGDAPEIDGRVYLRAEPSLRPGTIVTARVVDSDPYDLWAERV